MGKVITIDGPSGVGKGTVGRVLAKTLGWGWLDSGALYRLTALHAQQQHIDLNNQIAVAKIAEHLPVTFDIDHGDEPFVLLADQDVTQDIRTETCGNAASKIAAYPPVRQALLQRQRDFLTERGLVADGRDMGTVIFPNAPVKIFLQASAQVRAERRFKQLQQQSTAVNFNTILQEIETRDLRDRTRAISPLIPAADALVIDTSDLTVDQVFQQIMAEVKKVFIKGAEK